MVLFEISVRGFGWGVKINTHKKQMLHPMTSTQQRFIAYIASQFMRYPLDFVISVT